MSCIKFGITISNDNENGKLYKAVMNAASKSGCIDYTLADIFAGYVNNSDFISFVRSHLTDNKDFKNLYDVHSNTISALLIDYFEMKHLDVNNSIAKQHAEALEGFTSSNAKLEAISHTADLILSIYEDEMSKSKKERLNRIDVLNKVKATAKTRLINKIAKNLVARLKSSKFENNQNVQNRIKDYDDAYQNFNSLREEYNQLCKESKDTSKVLKDLTKAIQQYETLCKNLIVEYKSLTGENNGQELNYLNLVNQLYQNPNKWFFDAFTSSKLTNIVREFEEILEDEKLFTANALDENDHSNIDNDTIDETAKNWEDSLYKSFDKHVDASVKLYLSRLYNLGSPDTIRDPKTNQWIYDENADNEIGVPMTMGANFIIAQIINGADFNSVNDFIDSIERISKVSPSLYGLVKLVNDMRDNVVFANKVFTQLNNPKIIKTMISLNENGFDIDVSNRAAEPMTLMLYTMMNSSRSNSMNQFDEKDIETINKLINQITTKRSENLFTAQYINKQTFGEYSFDFIWDTIHKYFPTIDKNAIRNYIYKDGNKIKNIESLLKDLKEYIAAVGYIKDTYNDLYSDYILGEVVDGKRKGGYKEWATAKQYANEAGLPYNQPEPKFDYSKIPYDKLTPSIIKLSSKLVNYSLVKTELNSTNAEGNMSSDLMKNSYITNLMKQIAYGTENDANIGLKNLADFVNQGEQYIYNPLFFGIKDKNGKVIQQGLFTRDSTGRIRVNDGAKELIKFSLFDGAKDQVNNNSAMYTGMSKGDYFLTTILAYNQPVDASRQYDGNRNKFNDTYGGFFLRTPSDAPKNFILQTKKYNIKDLWINNVVKENEYIDSVLNKLASKYNLTTISNIDETDDIILGARKLKPANKINSIDFYNILNQIPLSLNYNNYTYIIKEDKILIPIENNGNIIWLEGIQSPDTNNRQLVNIKIAEIVRTVVATNEINFGNNFKKDIRDVLVNEGVMNGSIDRRMNHNNPLFRAAYSHLVGELNNFINNLNNVFEKVDGQWVTKKDNQLLIDRAHYNDSIVKDGQLTGNFFKFIKLFETSDINVDKEIKSLLSLYGGSNALLLQGESTDSLNLNIQRTDIINIVEDKINLVLNENTIANLENIVEKWINSFNNEIINRTQQFNILLTERFSITDVIDCMLNTAVMEMSFDDLLEGDVKFYKNAQDFLKRAKEIQAGGKSYAAFNINDSIGGKLNNITDKNGNIQEITINGRQIFLPRKGNGGIVNSSLTARNGFRGVTIYNTIKPSDNAAQIKQDLLNSIDKNLPQSQRERIATEIAKGYFEKTKVNDAQSYITFEEFIARKWADGTLNEYTDLINQILDVREGKKTLEQIDLKGINARIQVQKNFYFDKQFDPDTRTFYPRQIKNAEFVIIPELVKGTELEVLYNLMKKYDIDQINTAETDKAAKRSILTFWDNEGKIHAEEFENALKNDKNTETYYYRYLYKQQDVPQHLVDEKNKAGIQIMKKVLDNITKNTSNYAKTLMESYVANIKDDFNTLLFNMGWSIDNDGNIINNTNGSQNLDFNEFYKKARVEAQRLGMDSNFIEYLTPDILGEPTMPNYMNNVSTKLENIAQSIFNNIITRQTLPGWHAAQVTGVGHGSKILDSNGKLRELKYHPKTDKQEAYVEVLIPRWSNLIPKDYDVSKLDTEGLDIHIGYRIPTEGKQSVAVLKVVGFLDDIYGSTIMVPDEWVTQTGSDFDVDSIYGISFEMYKDKNNNIHKITIDKDESEDGIIRRYCNYITTKLQTRIDKTDITDSYIKEQIKELYNKLQDANERVKNDPAFKEAMDKYSEIYKTLSNVDKEKIRNIDKSYTKKQLWERFNEIGQYAYDNQIKTTDETEKDKYYQLSEAAYDIADIISLGKETISENYKEFRKDKDKIVSELFTKAKQKYFEDVQNAAKKANLISFEEFSKLPLIEQQSRKARNNAILQAMVDIMSHEDSREENYSRSNFDDLTDAMNNIKALKGTNKITRSAYNPLDQIDFFENAISGRKLKAFSVTRDTFNSICNYTEARLSQEHYIDVIYDLDTGLYGDIETLKATFGENNVNKIDGTNLVKITHTRIGNSLNNRNVVGKLLTVYSSQTTAHILDAIKEGAIPNENEYTFGTFKTLIDIGIDYNTAIAFLMQPSIDMLVEANNEGNSIYINHSNNPINTTIKRIAKKLDILVDGEEIKDWTNIKGVWEQINNNEKLKSAFKELFGAEFSEDKAINEHSFTLNNLLLHRRLNLYKISNNDTLLSEEDKYIAAALDIANILFFNKVHETTKNIEAIARCAKPDSFGATQTIHGTRRIKDDIIKYITQENQSIANTILYKDTNLLKSLYPNIEHGDINVNESSYSYLAAFFKYATMASVNINSQLFITENDTFNAVVTGLENKLGKRLSDEQYKELKSYIIQDVYRNVPLLTTPITINKYGLITYDTKRIKDIIERERIILPKETLDDVNALYNVFHKKYWDFEKYRIFGYDVLQNSSIKVEDINNPTEDEIYKFNNLTPAQKVIWIQQNFVDDAGIFNNLKVNTFHQKELANKGYSAQSIKFNDQIDNIEEIYRQFNNAFFNKNPFVRLAAIDLIKYAFVVEGFNFKKGGISKIITNKSLYADLTEKGMQVVPMIRESMNLYTNILKTNSTQFIDNFVRSHSNIVKEVKIPKNSALNTKLASLQTNNMYYIPYQKRYMDLLEQLTVGENDSKNYIKINKTVGKNRITTLYKIKNTKNGVYLLPMNLLERNELDNISVNKENNKFKLLEYYENIAQYSSSQSVPLNLVKDNKDLIEQWDALYTIKPRKFIKVSETLDNPDKLRQLQERGTNKERAIATKFINDIDTAISAEILPNEVYQLVFNNEKLISDIFPIGVPTVQHISTGDETYPIKITQIKPSNNLKYILRNNSEDFSKLSNAEQRIFTELKATRTKYPKLYKIEPVIEEEIKKEYEEIIEKAKQDFEVNYSIVSPISDINVDDTQQLDDIDKVGKNIYETITYNALKGDTVAEDFKRKMDIAGVNKENGESLFNNRKNIYEAAAEYYRRKSIELLDNINKFKGINTKQTFEIDDKDLYIYLRDNHEDYFKLVKVILQAKTFGDQFYDIFNLKLDSEDPLTKNYIKEIQTAINRVRDNKRLSRAVNLLFNDFIANEFASNPMIRNGFIELKEQFGDIDWFDLQFSDIGEINHQQIQTVVKLVYGILNEAATVIAPKSIAEFNNKYDAIMKLDGTYDENKFIKNGKFINAYNDDFIKDRDSYTQRLKDLRNQGKEFTPEYYKLKLERDKWRLENTEQEYNDNYYRTKLAIEEKAFRIAGTNFLEYLKLRHELYKDNRNFNSLSDEEKEKYNEIRKQIEQLKSDAIGDVFDATMKSEEELLKASAIRDYENSIRKLNNEYFDYDEKTGFRETLEYFLNIMDNYDDKHPYETLDVKLKDPSYYEAYNWIKANSIRKFTKEAHEAIQEAFSILMPNSKGKGNSIKVILKDAGAYDEFGNVNPTKLTKDQIKLIKDKILFDYTRNYESDDEKIYLIKDTPRNLPIYDNKIYKLLKHPNEFKPEIKQKRTEIIKEINSLIVKGLDKQGHINSELLFENLTRDQLKRLGQLYKELKDLRKERKTDKNYIQKLNGLQQSGDISFVNNQASYKFAREHLNTLRNAEERNIWFDIFTEEDYNGAIIPNNDLFGYMIADKKYIDNKRTKAKNTIENNLVKIPTEYYYNERRKAIDEGRGNEWDELNHIYNPHTHKVEPLNIWLQDDINPNGDLKGSFEYIANFENQNKKIKEQYVNESYNKYSTNYKYKPNDNGVDTNRYANKNITTLSDKERKMLKLLQDTVNFYTINNDQASHSMKSFAKKGFLPRRAKYKPDAQWYISQGLGALGLEFRHTGETEWTDYLDFVNDRDIDFDMMSILKTKGYKELKSIPAKGTSQSDEEYAKMVEDIRKDNKKIEEENLRLEQEILDTDWKGVFNDFIAKAIDYNARNQVKNSIYLLLEDLKSNDAYKLSNYSGNLIKNSRKSIGNDIEYQKIKQERAYELVQNWGRRIIFNQFKKNQKFTKWADLMQNITSAKYMIFNVTGGIANIGTGTANIFNEVFAKQYFDVKTWGKAQTEYFSNSLNMLADMYKPTTNNFTVGLIKMFDVVDVDAFTERRNNESATDYVARTRNALYSLQSGGEHYMQNTVLLAMINSHRIFKDTDGQLRIGNFMNYIWSKEIEVMKELLKDDKELLKSYETFIITQNKDKNLKYKYATFNSDYNADFIRGLNDKEFAKKYITARKEAIKNAKTEFNQEVTLREQFELTKDGIVLPKPDSILKENMIGEFRQKVIQVNKLIHGVYDKIGAAKIESEWWGGLVMQYHKHLYPGIMKRWRMKGYYNELRESVEKGSYIALGGLLSTEFRGITDRIKKRTENQENVALASLQEVIKAFADTWLNLGLNYQLMPVWEQNVLKRSLGDLLGVASAFLLAISIHLMTDDDEIQDNNFFATMLYMADRLNAEAQMYTPWGLWTEGSTLWSSPIAAQNGPKDFIKAMSIGIQALYDDDFDINYTTGLYKGQNKLAVLLYRNTPIYRVYQRLSTMDKNNSYYRINETALNIKAAKTIADTINPD